MFARSRQLYATGMFVIDAALIAGASALATANVDVALPTAGAHHFLCRYHCDIGMRLSVDVVDC